MANDDPKKPVLPDNLEELDALLEKSINDLDRMKDKLRLVRAHRDKIAAKAEAARVFGNLSAPQREAMAQHIAAAGGVAPTSAVGTPGKS